MFKLIIAISWLLFTIDFAPCYADEAKQSQAQVANAPEQEAKIYAIDELKKAGANSCIKATAEVLNYLVHNGPYNYINTLNEKNPDQHSKMTLIIRPYEDGSAFALLTSSETKGGCDITFMKTYYSDDPCTQLRETAFKDWTYDQQLGTTSTYHDPASSDITVTLTAQGNGCMMSKSGMMFFPSENKQ